MEGAMVQALWISCSAVHCLGWPWGVPHVDQTLDCLFRYRSHAERVRLASSSFLARGLAIGQARKPMTHNVASRLK